MALDDDVTPLTMLNNTALHLGGPPRTQGAVMIGHAGESHVFKKLVRMSANVI